MKLDKTLLTGCAVAAALAIGCSNNESRTNNPSDTANRPAGTPGAAGTAGTAGTAADARDTEKNATTTLTGCLQEKKGMTGDYILTQVNLGSSGSAPVGTTGSTSSGSAIEQKQMSAAKKSYRLSGETDQLKNLVGHEVRVSGTVTDEGDIAKNPPSEKSPSASGKTARDIDQSDLPKVDVASVSNVSDSCGAAGKPEGASKPKSKR
jgi:hypothetical protein